MILVKPSHKIEALTPHVLQHIEKAGRTCYKSGSKITPKSAEKFVGMIIKRGHESVIEHASMTVRFICDRGVTHEIVRHRLVAYSQESTRYCNYKGGVIFVIPPWVDMEPGEYFKDTPLFHDYNVGTGIWFMQMIRAEDSYIALLLQNDWIPQQARSVLPNSLKTEIVCTANLREWRHILKLRCSKAAHPQMQELMKPLLKELKIKVPIIFDDLGVI
ncbi:MAG TPA: FAD-dependent thymidylate synthase [bacterium]|nr:FAD-dependent thymidylate synthase [bacterium]